MGVWNRRAAEQGKTDPAQDQLFRERSSRRARRNTPSSSTGQPPPISPTRPSSGEPANWLARARWRWLGPGPGRD